MKRRRVQQALLTKLALGAMVALGILLGAARNARCGASARLVYVRGPGGEGCPDEQTIRAAVAARLGYDPFFAWAHDTLFVDVTGSAGAFHVDLKLVDSENNQRGARSIAVQGSDCASVIQAMALTISLTIDPESVMGGPAASTTTAPGSASASATAPPPPTASSAAPSQPHAPAPERPPASAPTVAEAAPSIFYLGAGPAVSVGAAPGAALASAFFVGLRWPLVSFDLEGRVDFPAAGDGGSGIKLQSWLAAASLVPCFHLKAFYGCGVATLGVITATATNPSAQQSSAVWAAGGPRLGLEIELSKRFALRAWGEFLATLTPYTLRFYTVPSVTLAPVSGGGGVGASFRFR